MDVGVDEARDAWKVFRHSDWKNGFRCKMELFPDQDLAWSTMEWSCRASLELCQRSKDRPISPALSVLRSVAGSKGPRVQTCDGRCFGNISDCSNICHMRRSVYGVIMFTTVHTVGRSKTSGPHCVDAGDHSGAHELPRS